MYVAYSNTRAHNIDPEINKLYQKYPFNKTKQKNILFLQTHKLLHVYDNNKLTHANRNYRN